MISHGTADTTDVPPAPLQLAGVSHRQHIELDALPLAAHIMQHGSVAAAFWSDASVRDAVAVVDAVIDVARTKTERIYGGIPEHARDQTHYAREVIASASLVPGASESLGSELVELERAARHGTMSKQQLDRLESSFEALESVTHARTRARIAALTAPDSLTSLSAADEARIRFEAMLEQTPSRAAGS